MLQGAYLSDSSRHITLRENNINGNIDQLIERDEEIPSIRELDQDALRNLPIGLTDILKQQITEDHIEYWKYTYDTVKEDKMTSLELPEDILYELDTLIQAIRCTIPEQANSPEHAVLERSDMFASYLSYSVLEGTLKVLCSDEIERDGTVKPGHEINGIGGRSYQGDSNWDECNKFADLLYHLEEDRANADFKSRLVEMRQLIREFYKADSSDIYELLQDNRNSTVHGQNKAKGEYGVVMNLICLLIWNADQMTAPDS